MNEKIYPWMVLSVTSLGILLSGLSMSTLNVALPEVASFFNAGAMTASWILLSFMLVNSILILVFGRIADIYGRRNMFMIGLTLFSLANLVTGFSPNIWVLIIMRVLQAVGSALVISNVTPLIADAFPEETLGLALGLNIFIVSIAQLIGPALGGYLAFTFGWRWVFWFNVPVGLIGVIWAIKILKSANRSERKEKVDMAGNITMFLSLSGLILALSEGGVIGWLSGPVIGAGAVFIIFLAFFIWRERKTDYPVIDFKLFKDRSFSVAIVTVFLNALVRYSVVLLMALFFQVVGRENSLTAGLQVLPVAIGLLMASPITGWLSVKYSARLLSTLGLMGTGLGMLILMLHISENVPIQWMIAGQFLTGFGSGIFMTPNTKSIMLGVPKSRRGVANGIRSMMQNMGQLVSTALSLMIVSGRLPLRLKDALYQGAGAQIEKNDALLIAAGYRTAFFMMLLLSVLAVAVSFLRTPANESSQTDNF